MGHKLIPVVICRTGSKCHPGLYMESVTQRNTGRTKPGKKLFVALPEKNGGIPKRPCFSVFSFDVDGDIAYFYTKLTWLTRLEVLASANIHV